MSFFSIHENKMLSMFVRDNLGKENEQVSLHLFIKGAFICTEIVVYCQCGFAIDYYCLCKQKTDLLFLLSDSASPPPLEAASLPRGMVTMRCDITTCSISHVSLLVSGSAQTCFDDQVYIPLTLDRFFFVLPCKVTWCSLVCAASREPHQE